MIRHPHRNSSQRPMGRINAITRRTMFTWITISLVVWAIPVFLVHASGITADHPANIIATDPSLSGNRLKTEPSEMKTAKALQPQAPTPTYTTGAITFGPATPIDFQRTEGEPINHVDKDGNYWETGPWGFSTNQSFVHRSTDGGDQFNLVSPIELRPNSPPGGGDSDVITDDQGNVYFNDLEGPLTEIDCSVSNDNGNTWRKNAACVPTVGDDRQWFTIDNGANQTIGAAGAADNTIFLTYRHAVLNSFILSSPGSTGPTDLTGGLVFTNTVNPPGTVATGSGAPCGQIKFDPVHRNLYLPCINGGKVQITKGHVNVGQRTGIVYTNILVPSSSSAGNLFPTIAVDKAGTIYAVWVNTSNQKVFYAYSTDQAVTWSSAVQVSQPPANTNVFAWAAAGSDGRLAVAWYGTETNGNPSSFPRWYADRPAAAGVKWFGYAALITGANTLSPNIEQNRFTHKPTHYGQVCLSGLGCSADPTSDRTMADYMAVTIDNQGRIRPVYNDTTSQHHGAHLFEARQISGPSALGTTINDPVPANPMADPTGDAQSPHYSPTGPGANLPQLDFTQVKLGQSGTDTLQVQMTLNNLSSLAPPTGKANALWITRFQAQSLGEESEESYRIFYVGAESVAGGQPTFFVGSGTASDPTTQAPGNGCNTTTPQNCKVVQYPAETIVAGTKVGNTFCINVPLSSFGAGRPIATNATLYNVTAFSGGRNNSLTDFYADTDSTRSFDYTLGTINGIDCNALNVALDDNGGTATASSEYVNGGYPATSANDGEHKGTDWGNNGGWNDGTRSAYPDWLQVAFNNNKTINQIIVYTLQNDFRHPVEPTPLTPADFYGIEDFEVEYWDGTNWVDIPGGNVTGNDKAMRIFTFAPVTTSKVRVLVTNARMEYSRITELEVFGVTAP